MGAPAGFLRTDGRITSLEKKHPAVHSRRHALLYDHDTVYFLTVIEQIDQIKYELRLTFADGLRVSINEISVLRFNDCNEAVF